MNMEKSRVDGSREALNSIHRYVVYIIISLALVTFATFIDINESTFIITLFHNVMKVHYHNNASYFRWWHGEYAQGPTESLFCR